MKTIYKVEGMTCGGCTGSVTRALQSAGAEEVEVDLKAGTAALSGLDEATAQKVIEDAGFDFGGTVSLV